MHVNTQRALGMRYWNSIQRPLGGLDRRKLTKTTYAVHASFSTAWSPVEHQGV